jgi:hypothetical protein
MLNFSNKFKKLDISSYFSAPPAAAQVTFASGKFSPAQSRHQTYMRVIGYSGVISPLNC